MFRHVKQTNTVIIGMLLFAVLKVLHSYEHFVSISCTNLDSQFSIESVNSSKEWNHATFPFYLRNQATTNQIAIQSLHFTLICLSGKSVHPSTYFTLTDCPCHLLSPEKPLYWNTNEMSKLTRMGDKFQRGQKIIQTKR